MIQVKSNERQFTLTGQLKQHLLFWMIKFNTEPLLFQEGLKTVDNNSHGGTYDFR